MEIVKCGKLRGGEKACLITFDLQFDIVMAQNSFAQFRKYVAFTHFSAVFPYKTMLK